MKRAPAALATVLVLSGLRTVRAEPCPPRAELGGDGAAVERVGEELRRLGVAVARPDTTRAGDSPAATRCLVVRAHVALDGSGGILVAVRGAARGSEGRVVSDAALAATWIDSWTREDVDVALWAAPLRVATVEPTAVVSPRDVSPATRSPPTPPRRDRIAIAADYEQSWTNDNAAWSGVSGSVCLRVGSFCIGGRARLAFDPERLHNSTGVVRNDFSVLATASYPVVLGTMSIAPEVGLGVGRVTTARAEGTCKVEPPPNCDPMDPTCQMMPPNGNGTCTDPGADGTAPKLVVGDNFSASTYTPRLALALRVAVPLFEQVWLDGLAGITVSPFAHDGVFEADKVASEMFGAEAIALPGEPTSGYVLGIGLRWGAR